MNFQHIINGIYGVVDQHWIIAFLIGTLFAILESFLPFLPLSGIVVANSMFLGLIPGFIASIIGSVIGSILLFYLSKRFGNLKFFQKHKSEKTEKIMNWIKKQDFLVITLVYSCPFLPGFLFTMASGFSGRKVNTFIPGLISGKMIYFYIVGYVGNDVIDFITSPFKIIVLVLFVLFALLVGKRISKRIS